MPLYYDEYGEGAFPGEGNALFDLFYEVRSPKTGVGNTRVLFCEILCMVSSGTLLLLRKKPKHIAQHAVKKHAVSQ